MRWVRHDHQGSIHFGILERDAIAQVDGMPLEIPVRTGVTVALCAVRLLPPVIPPTCYAAGIDYVQHVHNATARPSTCPRMTRDLTLYPGGELGSCGLGDILAARPQQS